MREYDNVFTFIYIKIDFPIIFMLFNIIIIAQDKIIITMMVVTVPYYEALFCNSLNL